ncbi:hypothetical protein [Sphaerotilus mobilis]|uniref:MotA/TolQ/ExbB proton channel family protein n=1 Tax=Sphaerotilus mobilis TaxID=47994 RepID=A0A4Q7LEK8_9BURK|nr:hypothetical protein [Sphaerotilus mobilis]RZS52896.1 hypothetical protein EV685_2517 [Sphaerotilus mobilis]
MSHVNVRNRPSIAPGVRRPWALLACVGITVAYVLGNVALYDSIVQLINSSSNPRFAIFILLVTVVGQVLAIYQAIRFGRESGVIAAIRGGMAGKRGAPLDIQRSALGQLLSQSGADADVVDLFGPLRADREGRGGEDRASVLARFRVYQQASARRLVLPGHIANTLIGLGLFGTFLGLIVTLKEVASLISIIAVTGEGDSAATMTRFFTQMSGPLAGMGEAFVASLLGLGGSMVNGLQMLALRRLQSGAVAEAEETYHAVAEAVTGGGSRVDVGGSGTDERLARLQIEAITGLRQDLSKQTEAILLASSKMRLASEAMQTMSALAEKRLGSDETRAQVEKVAASVAQRLETVARKFDDLQVAQNMLAAAAQTSAGSLADINLQAKFIADHNSQAVRELAGLRGTLVDAAAQARDHVTQMHAELRMGLQRDLASVVAAMAESSRELRDQTVLIGQVGAHAHETNLTLQTLDGGMRDLAGRIQPQLVEMVARLDASAQAESLATKYELSDVNRKLDALADDLTRRSSQGR